VRWLAIIGPALITLFVYILIKGLVLGLGIGVGFLLTWLLPALDFSVAMLIGVLATGISIHFFGNFLRMEHDVTDPSSELDELDEAEVRDVIDIIAASAPPPRGGRGRKRKTRWKVD
jgi:hypothetical protein